MIKKNIADSASFLKKGGAIVKESPCPRCQVKWGKYTNTHSRHCMYCEAVIAARGVERSMA